MHLRLPSPASRDNQKCFQTLPNVPWRQNAPGRKPPVEIQDNKDVARLILPSIPPFLSSWQTLLIDHSLCHRAHPPQHLIPGSPYQWIPPSTCNGTNLPHH